ncbi:ubiquitinyl hydrolase 1 [Ranunculus cassubicifolius]
MIYQPNRITIKKHLRKSPLGLKNLGNTCYLNSVLQCLTFTPPLANYCLNSQHSSLCISISTTPSLSPNCPFCILEKRISRSLTLESAIVVDSPNKICNNLGLFSENFRWNRQEDAHEFLRYVIDACHNTSLKVNKVVGERNCGETIVKEIFGGELRSSVKCVVCGGESVKNDEIMDVSLDLWQINSVKDALGRFFGVEVLNGTNKYQCDNCKKLVIAKKQMSVLKAPNILVIQLKRFEGIHGGKIDRPISFEESLSLSNYMCKESQDAHPEYKLYGTIVHSGFSQDSGHYYAYIKDVLGKWYCCNDSIVSLSSLQEVLSEKVYILFFTRSNKKSDPSKSSISTHGVNPHSNGHNAQKPKQVVPLKSLATRPLGSHNSEKIIPIKSVNGKAPSTPKIKFNIIKDHHGNGNGICNGHVKTQNGLKEVKEEEKVIKVRPVVTNGNGASANGSMDAETKPDALLLHGNGETLGSSAQLLEEGRSENNGFDQTVVNGRTPDSGAISQGESCNSSGTKRKLSDVESNSSLPPHGHQIPVENIREKLIKDVSSHLRSCSWYDEVFNFMRAKKNQHAQTGGSTDNDIELRNLMVGEAKQKFLRLVPAPLKAELIGKLEEHYKKRKLN